MDRGLSKVLPYVLLRQRGLPGFEQPPFKCKKGPLAGALLNWICLS